MHSNLNRDPKENQTTISMLANLIVGFISLTSCYSPMFTYSSMLTGEYSDKIGTYYGEKSLDVLIGVNTNQSGEFSVSAELISGDQIISTSTTDVSLISGNNTVTIQFPGNNIRHYRLDGPYQVKVLPIVNIHSGVANINAKNATWQTATYHWRDFGEELCFTLFAKIMPDSSVASMEITPPPDCTNGQYLSATYVTLKVVANPGFQFKSWGGDMGGVDAYSPVITLQMQRDMYANAFFEPKP